MTKKSMANEIVKKLYPNNPYKQAKMYNDLYVRKTIDEVKQIYTVLMSLSIA